MASGSDPSARRSTVVFGGKPDMRTHQPVLPWTRVARTARSNQSDGPWPQDAINNGYLRLYVAELGYLAVERSENSQSDQVRPRRDQNWRERLVRL